jgi:hypothetical protein
MKKVMILALAAALVGGVAYANFCARDNVPASTLLVPYVVVALGADGTPDPNGYTTLLGVTNVSSEAQLIHVTVWTARSSTVVDFDEVLTGYDVWTINFRDLLNGRFDYFDTGVNPADHTKAQPWGFWDDGSEDIGAVETGKPPLPWGPTSNPYTTAQPVPWDIDYATFPYLTGCDNPPYGNLSNLSGTIIANLKRGIKAVSTGYVYCKNGATVSEPAYLASLTTNPVFFYVTVDVVSQCSTAFPNEPAYWGLPYPKSANVLVGDIFYVDPVHNYSESIPAVAVESGLVWNTAQGTGAGNFYGRYTSARGVDDREPLATAFAFRYLNSGGISSEIRLWKNRSEMYLDDSTSSTGGDPRYGDYLGLDAWVAYACDPFLYFAWDENENVRSRGGGPSGFATNEPNPLPFETQSVPLTSSNFSGLLDTNGWMLLVLDTSVFSDEPPYGFPVTAITGPFGQWPFGWVGIKYNFGTYSTMTEAAVVGNAFCFPNQVLPQLGIGLLQTP